MTPREQAAVEAAVTAVEAHEGRHGGHRCHASRSAVDALEAYLGPLDWYSFDGRAFELLREVARRCGIGVSKPSGAGPADPNTSGAEYEAKHTRARRRLARATA